MRLSREFSSGRPVRSASDRGDPTVGLGVAFEAAALLGVPLFHEDRERRRLEAGRVDDRLAVLPKAVRRPAEVDDDF